jgi:hypothetical protein
MTCAEVQRILPEWMEGRQDAAFGAHLESCPSCSELVADLQLIVSEARQLATEEPAARVWVNIAAELRTEGLIREPQAAKAAPVAIVPRRWSAWWLVPVAAALIAGASLIVNHKPAATVAVQTPPAVQPSLTQAPAAQTPPTVAEATPPKASTQQNIGHRVAVQPGPSEEDQQFLSEVSQRAPSMRATYEDQLRSVNAYIAAAQAYLDQNPDDEDARQHLMEAYQQKALLYQLALDHIQ